MALHTLIVGLMLTTTALGFGSIDRSSDPSSDAESFAGLWQVVPRQHRPQQARDQAGRPLGASADDSGLSPGDRRVRSLMTEAGRKAFDALDLSDLPANNCRSPGLPSIAMTPNLQQWEWDGDKLQITHEYFSTVRTIHREAAAPEGLEASEDGFATGAVDGRDLVIQTTHLAAMPGGLSRNAPSSDARVVTERYRILDGGDAMEGRITIEDERFLTQAIELTVRLERAEPGTELVLFPCDLEASRRHLDG